MKKLTKLSLDQLAKELSPLKEQEQMSYYGGGDGSPSSPYSLEEWSRVSCTSAWNGGWVDVGGAAGVIYFGANIKATWNVAPYDTYLNSLFADAYGKAFNAALTESSEDDHDIYIQAHMAYDSSIHIHYISRKTNEVIYDYVLDQVSLYNGYTSGYEQGLDYANGGGY